MIWTRIFMRSAFIFIVVITMLTPELDVNIGTWIQLADGVDLGVVEGLEAGENRLYAGASYGIFISDDRGRTWRHMSDFNMTALRIAVDGNTVYVGTWSRGVFRSDDAGESWKPIRNGLISYENDDGERYWGRIRQMLINFDEVIAVAYHSGTYVSNNQGVTWHDVSDDWEWWADSIWSMTQFNVYLWSAVSTHRMYRSSDNGRTWEWIPEFKPARVTDWAALYNRLYVAGEEDIGRWDEKTRTWEYLVEGLPTPAVINCITVHDGRLYAGLSALYGHGGVYVFNLDAETWSFIGLEGLSVNTLLSHKSILYAGTEENGIYCTSQTVHPHAKVVTTWARVKQGSSDRTGSAIKIPFQPHRRD